MTRTTSVYTLNFTPREVITGAAEAQLDLMIKRLDAIRSVTRTGSGKRGSVYYVMFRTINDAEAVALAKHLCFTSQAAPRFTSQTLTTGQGAHTRTINLEGPVMATTYHLFVDGNEITEASRAKKAAVIKAGEASGKDFEVRTNTGATVHTQRAEATAPANTDPVVDKIVDKLYGDHTKEQDMTDTEDDVIGTPTEKTTAHKAAKKTAAKKAPAKAAKDEAPAEPAGPSRDLEFADVANYYVKTAGLHGAEVIGNVFGVTATLRGTTLTLHGDDEDTEAVADHLTALWPQAKVAHRAYRKADKVYSEIDKSRKNKEANVQRLQLENAWFTAFMDGAADALAETVKRKGGAYKDGVQAIQNPVDDDVI